MKKIRSLLHFFLFLCLLLQACKKDKAEPPPPDPIALYPFNDGQQKNIMSPLLKGFSTGNVYSVVDSFLSPNSAFKFEGEGYVKVLDSDLLNFPGNQFTIAAWIRPIKPKHSYVIIKNDEATGEAPYTLDIYNGVVRSFVRTNTGEQFVIEGKKPIIAEAWQHIAVTFSGQLLTVYYNGENEGSIEVDRPLAIKKGDLAIGGKIENFPSGGFQGSVDNVHIYDKALTPAQVKNLYQHYQYKIQP